MSRLAAMPKHPRMKLVMTLLVRDAEGLLRQNLDFHLRQGVDVFVITDNRSTDGTAAIIEDYVRAGKAEYIFEAGDDFSQARWVTRMARRAFEIGADWVINSDDDEFWLGNNGSLREELERIPPERQALRAPRHNHPPVLGLEPENFLQAMVYRERCSTNLFGLPLLGKVCHRAWPDVEVGQGNHVVTRGGRPVETTPAETISISHYPTRDYPSLERKVVNGGVALARNNELEPEMGLAWRRLYDVWREGRLKDWYEGEVLAPSELEERMADGRLFLDDRVLRTLAPQA